MEKSPNYYRRKELMKNLEVPKMSEVKKEFGDDLADVIFQQCPEALQEEMGLKPKLKGAGNTLWISPSDLLAGKVCLKPPLTDKHMKALTHEGILEIGHEIDKRYWEQMEAEKEAALKTQEAYLKKVSDCELYVAVKRAVEEERAKCQQQIVSLMMQFKELLQNELVKLEVQMARQQEQVIAVATAAVEAEWKIKLQNAVHESVEKMTATFMEDLQRQKNELIEGFRNEFQNQHREYEYAMQEGQTFCKDALKQLKHWLECKNISNLVYIMCMERKKCEMERSLIETKYKEKICALEDRINEKDAEIKRLTQDRDDKQRQVNVREECVLEIMRQFQKFINFTLRATPTQAEFLLSVQKMMLFEFVQACVSRKTAKKLRSVILPWKSDSELTRSSDGTKGNKDNLVGQDYHKCLNEAPSPNGEDESKVVPAVYYDGNMYVREDFRNMFSQGLKVSETNLIWNRDVDHLMQILRSSDTDLRESKSENIDEIHELLTEELPETRSKRSSYIFGSKKLTSRRGSILKKFVTKESDETLDNQLAFSSVQSVEESEMDEREKSGSKIEELATAVDIEVSPMTVGLLATKDSLVKIRQSRRGSTKFHDFSQYEIETGNMLMAVRDSLQNDSKPAKIESLAEGGVVSFQNFDAIQIPDQIILNRPSERSSKTSIIKPHKLSQEKSILVQSSHIAPIKTHSVESRLMYTKDSLIIHKNSCLGSPPRPDPGLKRGSRLSFHRNSLELIRKMSLHSSLKVDARISDSLMVGNRLLSKESIHDFEKVKRIVSPSTVSHREIFKIPENVKDVSVNFSPIREVFESTTLNVVDSPWKLYQKPAEELQPKRESRDEFLKKPNEAKVVGDLKNVEHTQTSESFTMNRINSIMDILRDEPSLIKMFTSCTK